MISLTFDGICYPIDDLKRHLDIESDIVDILGKMIVQELTNSIIGVDLAEPPSALATICTKGVTE